MTTPQIVIVGAGFGGLSVARELKNAPASVTIVDQNNHHLFQPLLYQVATAGLSPADIATPIRSIVRKQKNTEVLMKKLTGIDVANHKVVLDEEMLLPFDYLILATGAAQNYFGHSEWEKFAPSLKTLSDATQIRAKILVAFERAEAEPDPEKRRQLLTFVLVGAGPTGTEMAGAIAELASRAMRMDFRHIDPKMARILLIEAGPRILPSFPESLSSSAKSALEKLGVEVWVNSPVEQIEADGVKVRGEWIRSCSITWTAGVSATPVGRMLPNVTLDRMGRIEVLRDLSVPNFPNIFVIGDLAHFKDVKGHPLPGLAPVAIQQGRFVANLLCERLKGQRQDVKTFRYHDKGNLATIGRSRAVADLGKLRLSGFIAWILWIVVHIIYLIGFRNRLIVLIEWAWSYLTFQRGARLITGFKTRD